jgi:hypothetical protein
VGLCMFGVWLPAAISDGFVVAFGVACLAYAWGLDSSSGPRSQPYESAKYGTAASEIQELRLGMQTQDVSHLIEENQKRLRGQ